MSSQILTDQKSTAVFSRLMRANQALARELSARLITEHGLTINDYECLLHLSQADEFGLKRVELAERLQLTPSGVTRLLDGLERDGWVRKGACDSDLRVTYAVLTEEGRERMERAGQTHVAQIREIFEARFSPEELEALVDLLGRLPGADAADGGSCAPPS
jgi:DNA-binding MarR family transcriptional regulator